MNTKLEKQFELTPVGSSTYLFLAVISLLPILLVVILWAINPNEFTDVPLWVWPVVLFLGPIIIIISVLGMRDPKVNINSEFISFKVSFLKKKWVINELIRDQIRVIDLDKETELKPKWKLMGAAMPGLRSGYFRLNNKQNAHVYLTNFDKVVYIPTHKGPLLLSLQRPKEFMDYLQSL
jgi:hypothetical protein